MSQSFTLLYQSTTEIRLLPIKVSCKVSLSTIEKGAFLDLGSISYLFMRIPTASFAKFRAMALNVAKVPIHP